MPKRKFPGFDACMQMMRKRDPQLQEDGFWYLLPHAHEYVDELMAEFHKETDHGLRCWLLELIGHARSPQAFALLLEHLRGDDESFWTYAMRGLKALDTKEARYELWLARSHGFASEAKTARFQQELARIVGEKP